MVAVSTEPDPSWEDALPSRTNPEDLAFYQYVPHPLEPRFPFWCNRICYIGDRSNTPLHSHNSLEIGYCHQGSGIFVVSGKILPFHSGDVSVITSNEVHQAWSDAGTKCLWSILFLDIGRLVDPHFPECIDIDGGLFAGASFSNILHEKDYPRTCRTVRSIIDEAGVLDQKGRILIKSLLTQFIIYLDRELLLWPSPRRQIKSSLVERLKPAIELVMTAYGERINIPLLAERCCMSPRNFSRLFRKALDKSPRQHVMEVRFAMACNQLKATGDPIGKVALDNGFPTISSFNRMFRKKLNDTPRRWRDMRAHASETHRVRA